MQTKRWLLNSEQPDETALTEAAELLQGGYTVSFPTETVYGLGADATNAQAVSSIFRAKERPEDNPLIAHVASIKQLQRLVTTLPSVAEALLNYFTPGPLTLILPSNGMCADNVTAGLPSVGVRLPSHPVAHALLKACDRPIAAPSANLSGKPSPTTADHVWADLQGKLAGLVDAGPTGVGVESTVVDCTRDMPAILRPGGITKEQLEAVIGPVSADTKPNGGVDSPKAPGMKYTHYAPEVPMYLVEGSVEALQTAVYRAHNEGQRVGVLASTQTAEQLHSARVMPLGSDLHTVAATIYDALRLFTRRDVDVIFCEAFPQTGIGQAIMNRLEKAANGYAD